MPKMSFTGIVLFHFCIRIKDNVIFLLHILHVFKLFQINIYINFTVFVWQVKLPMYTVFVINAFFYKL